MKNYKKVITWSSGSGNYKINLCVKCEIAIREWPKDPTGREFCQVYRGLHYGLCDRCDKHKHNT